MKPQETNVAIELFGDYEYLWEFYDSMGKYSVQHKELALEIEAISEYHPHDYIISLIESEFQIPESFANKLHKGDFFTVDCLSTTSEKGNVIKRFLECADGNFEFRLKQYVTIDQFKLHISYVQPNNLFMGDEMRRRMEDIETHVNYRIPLILQEIEAGIRRIGGDICMSEFV